MSPLGTSSASSPETSSQSLASFDAERAAPFEPLASRARTDADEEEGVILSPVKRRERPHGQSRTFALVAVLALLTGTTAGAWVAERNARATSTTIDHEVRVLRAEEGHNHEELVRQAALITAAQESVAATASVQQEAEARAEARSARIAADVASLADRTQKAQARTDARVYRLDEAMRLVDWVTTKGLARQVIAEGSPSERP
jgi:hypothetical protein